MSHFVQNAWIQIGHESMLNHGLKQHHPFLVVLSTCSKVATEATNGTAGTINNPPLPGDTVRDGLCDMKTNLLSIWQNAWAGCLI